MEVCHDHIIIIALLFKDLDVVRGLLPVGKTQLAQIDPHSKPRSTLIFSALPNYPRFDTTISKTTSYLFETTNI